MVVDDTRTRILDIAQDLIQRRGLNAMSYEDISRSVGIKKASVHHHFATKGDLVRAVVERYRFGFQERARSILASRASAATKLRRYFDLFVATLDAGKHDKACLCGTLAGEFLSLSDENVVLVRGFLRDQTEHLQAILELGARDGSLTVGGDVSATASMLLAMLEGGLLVARCDGGPKRMKLMLEEMVRLVARA